MPRISRYAPSYRRRRVARRRPYARRRTTVRRPRISGRGAYSINSNSLMMGMDPPRFQSGRHNCVRICHREYLGILTASASSNSNGTEFAIQTYRLQPGNAATFPWLSNLCNSYEEYVLKGCVIELKSMYSEGVAVSGTSGSLGTMAVCTQYDSSRPVFTNMTDALQSEYSTSSKPSVSQIHMIECARKQTAISDHLYINTGAVPSNSSIQLYDHAQVSIMSEFCQATGSQLAQIWNSYDVELWKPISPGLGGATSLLADHFQITSPTASNLLGSSRVNQTGFTIGAGTTSTVYTFPTWVQEGNFMFTYFVVGTGAVIAKPTITLNSGGSSLLQVWPSSTGFDTATFLTSPADGVSSVQFMEQFIVSIGPNALLPVTVTYSGGTIPTAATYADLWVQEVNRNIVT